MIIGEIKFKSLRHVYSFYSRFNIFSDSLNLIFYLLMMVNYQITRKGGNNALKGLQLVASKRPLSRLQLCPPAV
jgi:hypothetical protein